MDPIQLIPHQGSGWAPRTLPERLRAIYSSKHGVRHLLGAYDVHADRLHGRIRPHKSAKRCSGSTARSGSATHFWAIGEFVVNNADYPDWNTFKKAMADHIQYRNGPHRDQRLLKAERRLLIAA
jgi:hypothetical protein